MRYAAVFVFKSFTSDIAIKLSVGNTRHEYYSRTHEYYRITHEYYMTTHVTSQIIINLVTLITVFTKTILYFLSHYCPTWGGRHPFDFTQCPIYYYYQNYSNVS